MSRTSTDSTTAFVHNLPESADELQAVLSAERQQLKRSLDELGSAVREKVNVKSQLREHPLLTVGVAFAGGVLLGVLSKRAMADDDVDDGTFRRPGTKAAKRRRTGGGAFGHMTSTIAALVGQRLASVAEDTVRNALARRRDPA
jgi:ElaB/YqjD/DUF883 family membrane-anchored ribosome-binding protein